MSQVLFFRGKGLVSALIRFGTRSQYSHVAIMHEAPNGDKLMFESSFRKGPCLSKMRQFDDCIESFDIDWVNLEETLSEDYSVMDALLSWLGLPLRSSGYQCAEFVCYVLGINLDKPTPGKLYATLKGM